MKKLIPLVLGVWMVAIIGCTTTTTPATTTTTTTTQKQTNATMNPTMDNTRTTPPTNLGPR